MGATKQFKEGELVKISFNYADKKFTAEGHTTFHTDGRVMVMFSEDVIGFPFSGIVPADPSCIKRIKKEDTLKNE